MSDSQKQRLSCCHTFNAVSFLLEHFRRVILRATSLSCGKAVYRAKFAGSTGRSAAGNANCASATVPCRVAAQSTAG